MPESPAQAAVSNINGLSSMSTLSLGSASVQRDYQQKFLQINSANLAGEDDENHLERLLKISNVKPAKNFIRGSDWAPNSAIRAHLWIRLAKRLTTEADWAQSMKLYRETLPDVYRQSEGKKKISEHLCTML